MTTTSGAGESGRNREEEREEEFYGVKFLGCVDFIAGEKQYSVMKTEYTG